MPMKVILLYGLPCSGKSSAIKALPACDRLAVDDVIKNYVHEPSITDFERFSKIIVNELIARVKQSSSSCCILEMGCLIQLTATDYLQEELIKSGVEMINITLHAEDTVLIKRIIERNGLIGQGLSGSLPVHGPDYLSRFKQVFDKNKPLKTKRLDTSQLTPDEVIVKIKQIIANDDQFITL